MIRLENLSKGYGRVEALAGLSMTVPEGSIFGFVGPNGAGKTTTLRILATLLKPSGGRALIGDEDVVAHPERVRQMIGYMPDFFGVYDDLKVTEYLDFYGQAHGVVSGVRKRMIGDLLSLVDLEDKADAYVDSLSRGMKQRLCLARCLIHDPAVLLLDEPASGLDPRARVEMRELVKELSHMGKTVVVSSHILSELSEMCTEVGIIDHGRLVRSGPVDEVLSGVKSGRLVSIRTIERQDELAEALRQLPGVRDVAVFDGRLEAVIDGDAARLNETLRALIAQGYPVYSFGEQINSLEETFLKLTGSEAQ
ncbi:MAG: ATP-binding cassette domain-containing protein [Chloroflexota bacterium]